MVNIKKWIYHPTLVLAPVGHMAGIFILKSKVSQADLPSSQSPSHAAGSYSERGRIQLVPKVSSTQRLPNSRPSCCGPRWMSTPVMPLHYPSCHISLSPPSRTLGLLGQSSYTCMYIFQPDYVFFGVRIVFHLYPDLSAINSAWHWVESCIEGDELVSEWEEIWVGT